MDEKTYSEAEKLKSEINLMSQNIEIINEILENDELEKTKDPDRIAINCIQVEGMRGHLPLYAGRRSIQEYEAWIHFCRFLRLFHGECADRLITLKREFNRL